MADMILVADHGNWAEITLNRPDRLNSFTAEMHVELREALDSVAQKRALLLPGAGRGFYAAQDLRDRHPRTPVTPPDPGATVRTY